MRMAFGLVSLLVVIAIILVAFSMYTAPVAKQGKKTQDQARQIAGRDEEGNNATDSITLQEQESGGKTTGILVADVKPGGAMEKHFGFQKGDVILQIGPLTAKDNFASAGEAKDFLLDAFQRGNTVVVMRGWDQVTLPSTNAPVAAAAGTDAPAGTATGAQATADGQQPAEEAKRPARRPPNQPSGNSIQRQLDLIQQGQNRGDGTQE